MSDQVDWDIAARAGIRLVRPGPKLSDEQRQASVRRLRWSASRSVDLVAAASRLPGSEQAAEVTLVVDRAGMVRANAAVMSMVMDSLDQTSSRGGRVASRLTGAGAGVILAFIATNVLGQFEPFSNRLLLNAPSVEMVRAAIGANPDDFALWVCLHEQTHRQQFASAPWLRGHLLSLMRRFIELQLADDDEPPAKTKQRRQPDNDGLGLIATFGSPAAAGVVAEVTAVMSLLEGYADMLMDMAGAPVIPSLPKIRAAVDARRQPSRSSVKGLLGRAFGMAAKVNQYVDGKSFCQAVCAEIGLDGLNIAFTSPQCLPTEKELRDPSAWVRRCGASSTLRQQGDAVPIEVGDAKSPPVDATIFAPVGGVPLAPGGDSVSQPALPDVELA